MIDPEKIISKDSEEMIWSEYILLGKQVRKFYKIVLGNIDIDKCLLTLSYTGCASPSTVGKGGEVTLTQTFLTASEGPIKAYNLQF